jgi:phage terminase small subunit
MSRGLTRKQEVFVEKYIETGGNGTKAALDAYDTDNYMTAAAIASENLTKPKVQNALAEALPDDLLAKVHLEGLFATRAIFNKDGDNVGEDADFGIRAKYLDMAYKLKGQYAPEKRLNVNVDAEPSERIKELARKLNR